MKPFVSTFVICFAIGGANALATNFAMAQ